jgi:hypothetical protein
MVRENWPELDRCFTQSQTVAVTQPSQRYRVGRELLINSIGISFPGMLT